MSEYKDEKKFGQFFTNPIIADAMVKMTVTSNTKDFLDPATGPGIFVECAHKLNTNLNIESFEIDPEMLKQFKNNISFNVNIKNQDYLYSKDKKYDAIVCNPPYYKFQEIPDRQKLIKLFSSEYGIKLSGFTNYCIYFLIKSLNSLKENGRCCFIIPYEFMNTGYGKIVKDFLLKDKKLKYIIKFTNSLKLFNDAITTSCILTFENSEHSQIRFIDIQDVNDLALIVKDKFEKIKYFDYDFSEVSAKEKWLKYFKTNSSDYKNLIPFINVAHVKRGIATGNNRYFSLNKSDIEANNLSSEVCIPCVSKSADITELVMTQKYFDSLVASNRKMFVFDGSKKKTPADEKYIKKGEALGVNNTYLNRHRDPWYGLENKVPSPLWISVFSRDKFKVIRNEILIHNLTTFHGIYIKAQYEKYLDILFCYLQTPVAQKILRLNKREYAQGLDKFEPGDINNGLILDLSVISKEDLQKIDLIYKDYKKKGSLDLTALDLIFKSYIES